MASLCLAKAGTLTGSFAIIPPGTSVNLTTNGTVDWIHWGTYTEYAYDRKAGVTPVINNYTNVGTDNKGVVSIYQFSDNTNGYTWMDGSPTASITNSTTGLWAYKGVNVGNPKPSDYIGSGFVFSVPADTTLRRLNVYAGAFNGRLRFVATLSDGSAANYSNTSLNNTNNGPSGVYTITYAANSPGQTLWITNILAAGNGALPNVTLQAAALSAVTNNNLPLVWFNSPANYTSFLCPTNATLDVSALDVDGSITNVEFFESTNKLGEIASAPFTFVWSNAPPGKSVLTARATDNNGASRISLPLEVCGYTNGGSLSSTTAATVSNILLSTDGTHDWAHWGSTNTDSFDHRAGVPQLINNFSVIGTNSVLRLTNDTTKWSWTNGTPIFSITNSTTAVFIYGVTNGFELNLPAGTNSRTARIYTGVGEARGKFQASISDSSAPMFTDDSFQNLYRNSSRTYVLNYAAASEGQTLKIRYTDVVPFDSDFANVILRSVSLDVAAPLVFLTSPANSQHFAHGSNVVLSADAQDWTGAVTLMEFFSDAIKIGETTNFPYTFNWTNATENDHILTARATDNNGAAGISLPVTIAVATNAKPVVSLASPADGAHFIEGDLVRLTAQASDADDTALTVGFYTNAVKLGEVSTAPYTLIWSNGLAGNYTLTAIVTDPQGGAGTSAPVSILIVTNAWPTVAITSPTNGQGFFAPANITISAQASDSDGTVSLVEFFQDTNKLGQATTPPYTFNWSSVPKGNYTVNATVTDERGATNSSQVVAIIVSNRPPTAVLLQPTNSARFFEGTNLTLLADAQDLDGNVTLVEFFESTNKLGEAAAPPFSLVWSNVPRGDYILTVHAADNDGATTVSSTNSISVRTNTPPSIAISSPTNGQGFTTPVDISITADTSDSDGVVQLVEFFEGTNKIGEATSAPFSMLWNNVPRGQFSLAAIAYDDWDGVTLSAPVTINISNRPPAISLLTPTNGSHFFYPGTISLQADAADADGTISLVEFFESTNKLGEATNAPYSLVWSNVVGGDYAFTARAIDSEGAGSTSSLINVSVTTNIPPSVTISTPTNGAGLTTPLDVPITAQASDVDGIVRLVEFFESTNKLGESASAPFSIAWSNAPRGQFSITAIAYDDWDGVTTSTPVAITISNRPPSVSLIAPTNGSHFFYPGTVSLVAAAADADGTISLVEFFESTNKLGEATNAPFSVTWSNVSAGNYTLTAQATDNEGAPVVSAPISILVATNIPPAVTLTNPTNGMTFIEGDIVHLLANATDSDGVIRRVEFFQGTNSLGAATNAPYSLMWSNLVAGEYMLNAVATDDYGDTNESVSVSVVVYTNQFPLVAITAPTNGSAFFAPANVAIAASATDADGTVRSIRLFGDSINLASSSNNVLNFTWTNAPKGPHSLIAVATDDRSATNISAAISLFISNSPPIIAITNPAEGTTFIEGDVIAIRASVSDVDGSVTLVQIFNGTNQIAAITNSPFTFNWSNVLAGTYALSAVATDNDGASVTSAVVNVTMVTNQFPSVAITSPTNGAAFFAPTNLFISAAGSDPDGRVALLELFADNVKMGNATNSPFSLTWTNVPKGSHSLIAVVTDDRGATNISPLVNVIVSNRPPTIALTSPTNNSAYIEGDVISIAANANDLDGTNLVVTFFNSTNQLAQFTNAPFSFNWSNVLAGSYALSAVATDNDGASVTSAVVNVTMVTNQFPSVIITTPTNGAAFFAPTNLSISVTGSDPDGRVALLELFADNVKLANATNSPLSFTWTNAPKGQHSLTAVVTDDRGATNLSPVVNVVVSNRPPTIALASPTNNSAYIEGDVITIAANANDLDGINLVVKFFNSTNQLAQFTNAPFSFNWSNVLAGSYALSAVATDNDGASVTSAVVNITMVTNQFPSVVITTPTNGAAFFAPTNLSISVTGSDSDGRVALLELFADNVKLANATNSPLSFTWSNASKGQHSLTAVATDNRGATNVSPVVNVVVSNRPPTIALTSPTNNSAYIEGDVITIAANANDLDGTNLVVKFFNSTNQLAQFTNAPFSFNWSNVLAGSYALSAVATDNDGASVTSAVVNVTMVTNQFPSVIITTPTNGAAFFAPTNLSISVTGSDPDGRVALLELFADNVKLANATNSPLSFTWTNAPKGQHSLTAVATDNRGATNVSPLVNVVVSNRPPTIALTSPTNNSAFIEGDVITIAATANDLDGTNLVVKFFNSTNQLAQFTNAPFSFNWSNVLAGTYALSAITTDNDGASVTSAVVNITMVTNQFPTVAITIPTNGAAFFAPTNLLISVTGSDSDGRVALLELFADNVKLANATNSPLNFTWTNAPKGPHSLTATVTDNRGATNVSAIVNMIVSNRPPTIALINPTNNSAFIEGDIIAITATANDLDGTNLVVKFFNSTNQLAQFTNAPFSFNWSNVVAGSYALSAVATDNDGASVTSAVVNITMVTNQFPFVAITIPTNGAAFFAPTNLLISVTGSDPDGRVALLELFADNVKLANATNSPLSFTWTNAPKGPHNLTAVITDNRGATNVSPLVNVIVSNRPPTIALTSPTNNSTFIVGDSIIMAVNATDADGTNVLVQFLAGTNVLVQFTNAPYTFNWTNAFTGAYSLTALAVDNDGATNVSAAANIAVNTNQFPFVTITTPTNGSTLYSPIDIPITATAVDADGSITKLAVFVDGVKLGETTNSSLNLTWSNAPNGLHLLTAVANDDRGASNTSAPTSISVVPVAPNITSPPQSQTVIAGTNATFNVIATGSPTLKYQWRFNGTNLPNAATNTYTITNAQPTNNGSYSVIVSNGFGAITSSPAVLTVNFALNLAATAGGAVTKNPDRPSYAPGTIVTVTALTNWPYSFTGWSGALSGTNNPRTVVMNSNVTAVAQFTPFIADLIIDNPQSYATGAWTSASSATNKYGTNYLTAKALQTTSPTATATYTPTIPGSGGYDVYAWWPSFSKGSTSVPILISSAGSNVTVFINESTNSGGWRLVATNRYFETGTNGFARISNSQATQGLKDMVADAMRWVYSTNQTAWQPSILAGPSNQVAIAGSLLNFSVAAVGISPLTYQWRFNGTNLLSETNATLAFAPVQGGNAGNYQVVVTNAAGTATSALATLTVILPAQIVAQPQPQRVLAGSTALFSVTASGTAPLTYQWRFNASPISQATNASLTLTNVQSPAVGNYDVTVTNSGGAVTSTIAPLTINSVPTVSLLPTNGARYIEKDVIGVDVFSSDPDGSVTNITLLADAIVLTHWTTGASNHFAWGNAAVGSHILKAIVSDNDGATNTASSTISVVTNQFPSVAIMAPVTGSHYFAPTNLLINATASDADGAVTNLQLRVDGTLVLGQTNGSSLSLVWSNALKGTHTLTAVAADNRGATDTSSPVSITVSNRPPTVALTSPTNNAVFIEGDTITVAATAADADGTNVLVQFLAGTNVLVQFSNAPYTFNWSNVVAGHYALSATALDNDGVTVTSAVVNVTMFTNQFPSVAITTPTNGSAFFAPANVAISATAADVDGTIRSLALFADGVRLASASNSSLAFVWTNTPKGLHSLVAIASDDRGATNSSAAVSLFISNSPPAVAITNPTNGAIFIEGDTIGIQATASDIDGSIARVQIFNGTNQLAEITNAPFVFTWSNVLAGSYALSAIATDNDGATGTNLVHVTVLTNEFPSIAITTPTNGSAFFAPANVAIAASAADADGMVRVIQLYADGLILTSASNSAVNFTWTNAPKGLHGLFALAIDDRGATNVSSIVSLFISNTPPAVAITNPTNGAIFIEGDTIGIQATASDIDGSIARVQIFNGTNQLAEITNAPFVFTWSNVLAGSYALSAIAADNDGATGTNSVHVTVLTNQFPSISITTPTNGSAFFAPANVAISASAADADGTVRLIQLLADGTILASSSNSALNFTWTNAPKGLHSLVAVATDDRGATNRSSAVSLVISNTPPVVAITNPANGTVYIEGDAIALQAVASDVDGSVTMVDFFDGTNKLAQLTNAPFTFNWSNAPVGPHTVSADAIDDNGATNISPAVALTVLSNQPPQTRISSPTNSQTFTSPATITIDTVTSDADGAIRLIEFLANTNKIGQLTNVSSGPITNSFSLVWTNVLAGTYSLTTIATDDRGAVTTSEPIQITVSRIPPTLVLANPTATAGAFTFSFATSPDWSYRIECSDSLDPSNWTIVTNIPGDGSPVSVSTGFSTNQQKFYRVIAQ